MDQRLTEGPTTYVRNTRSRRLVPDNGIAFMSLPPLEGTGSPVRAFHSVIGGGGRNRTL
jgi:hypothetical protein